jgi:hypothetical protein
MVATWVKLNSETLVTNIARPTWIQFGPGGICVGIMNTILAETPAQIGVSLGHGSITYWEPGLKAKLWIDPN